MLDFCVRKASVDASEALGNSGMSRRWLAVLSLLAAACSFVVCIRFLPPVSGRMHDSERPARTQGDPSASCGPVSLAIISHWFDQPATIQEFNNLTGADAAGITTLLDLRNSLAAKGFGVVAVKLDPAKRLELNHPMIVHLPEGHFCVAIPVDSDRVVLIDPPLGAEVWRVSDLAARRSWRGDALVAAQNPADLKIVTAK